MAAHDNVASVRAQEFLRHVMVAPLAEWALAKGLNAEARRAVEFLLLRLLQWRMLDGLDEEPSADVIFRETPKGILLTMRRRRPRRA